MRVLLVLLISFIITSLVFLFCAFRLSNNSDKLMKYDD